MRLGLVAAAFLIVSACSLVRPQPAPVDVNAADARVLSRLPGLGPDGAERVVAGRPYSAKEDLLRRGILTETQYAAVAPHLYVGPPGMPDYLRAVPPMPAGP